jgi:hypothetical protein
VSTQLPTRIVRAWQHLYGSRGSESPRADPGIVSAVIIDDHRFGGYPSAEMWQTIFDQGAVAAQFANGVILNQDPVGTKSVVVVDQLWYQLSVLGSIMIALGRFTGVATSSAGVAARRDVGDDLNQLATMPVVQAVSVQNITDALRRGSIIVPTQDTLPHTLPGPWTLAPGQQFVVSSSVQNTIFQCYVQGRYYAPT